MEYINVFELISTEFGKENIAHVLIGGFAVNAHQVSRNTGDVDLLIATDDHKKAADILKRFEYREGPSADYFARMLSNNFKYIHIDFLFVERGTLERMINRGKKVKIYG